MVPTIDEFCLHLERVACGVVVASANRWIIYCTGEFIMPLLCHSVHFLHSKSLWRWENYTAHVHRTRATHTAHDSHTTQALNYWKRKNNNKKLSSSLRSRRHYPLIFNGGYVARIFPCCRHIHSTWVDSARGECLPFWTSMFHNIKLYCHWSGCN